MITLVATVFLLFNCSNERKVAKQLDGFWKINSYLIYKDSTNQEIELIGLSFTDGQLIFREYDNDLSTGRMEIVLTDIVTNEDVITGGSYSLDDTGEILSIDLKDERENALNVDAGKESLTMEGILDSARVKIEASR